MSDQPDIDEYVAKLQRSERGRVVLGQLSEMMEGELLGLDAWGQEAFMGLIYAAFDGRPQAVRDALSTANR